MPASATPWHSAAAFVGSLASTATLRQDDDHHDDEHESSNCEGNCLRNWKIIFCVLLFVEALVFAHLTLILRRRASKSQRGIKVAALVGNAVSAGVFTATGLLHILPESVELIAGTHGAHGEEGEHGEHEDEDHEERLFRTVRQDDDHGDDHDDEDGDKHTEDEHSEDIVFPWAYFIVMAAFYTLFFIERIIVPKLIPSAQHTHDLDEESPAVTSASKKEESSDADIAETTGDDTSPSMEPGQGFLSRAFFVALIQVLAISAHALFEAMALGLSQSFRSVLSIFIATVAHRWAIAITITMTMASMLAYIPFLVIIVLFSAMMPLGAGIGAALGSISSTVQGVLFAVSAGTFLYIGMFESMTDAFVLDKKRQFSKFLLTLLGAGIITIVTVILVVLDVHG